MQGLAEADVGLFVIDAAPGITPADQELADELRRQDKPVLLVANKCEGRLAAAQLAEAWSLGLGEPLPVSARAWRRHPRPARRCDPAAPACADRGRAGTAERDEEAERPLRLAVIGRPNAGKSTLINRLIDEDRLLTGPEPGLTRDSITLRLDWRGRRIELVDTAGLRRKAKVGRQAREAVDLRHACARSSSRRWWRWWSTPPRRSSART